MPDVTDPKPVLEARSIQRNFGAVVARADASITLQRGERSRLADHAAEVL